MKISPWIGLFAGFVCTFGIAGGADPSTKYGPGSRVQVLSHNAYPDHGKFTDRLDRSLAAGLPTMIEEDLAWIDGKSLLIHGAKNATPGDPTFESYFIPKVKPIMEKALREGNKGNWPLITLYLDLKNDPIEHLEAISKMLDRYDGWLTTATKTADINKISPLDLKPMMIFVEDKQNDVKQQFFYDRVPIGGKIRVFGSAEKFNENPNNLPRDKKAEAIAQLSTLDPEQLIQKKADNYRRWFGVNWAFVEKGGQTAAGEWSKAAEARLKKFVDLGHRNGYFVSVFCLNGYSEAENQGWDKAYNFGSKDKAMTRWKAAVKAHVDFISTDQVEDVAAVIKSTH